MSRKDIMIVHPEMKLKPAPLYNAWNGYLCIPSIHPAYRDIMGRSQKDEALGNCFSFEFYVPNLGVEECTFAKFMSKEEAQRFMEKPLYGDCLIIGFDSLHSWDTPETQTIEAVYHRLLLWKNAFEEFYKQISIE